MSQLKQVMRVTKKRTLETRIELVQLESGDIVLRYADEPEDPLVTISISEQVEDLMPLDRIDIAQAMVEAGIERYRDIQIERTEEIEAAQGMLH